MATSIVKYGAYTPEAAEQDEKSATRTGTILKLKAGKHRLRFLPPPVGRESIFKKVNRHFLKIDNQTVVFVCPRFQERKACPVCQEVTRLQKSGVSADREYAKEIHAQEGFFANVIDRAEPEKGVQIAQVSWGVHQWLTALAKDKDVGGDFTNPEGGFDIFITRVGTSKNDTKYTCMADRNATQLAPTVEEINLLIEGQPDLELLAATKSYDEIQQGMAGEGAPAAQPRRATGEHRTAQPQQKRRTAQDDVLDAEFTDDGDIPI